MYESYYDTLHQFRDPNLEGKPQLHYMDCDSFVLNIKTEDLVKKLNELQESKEFFDFTKIAKDHPLYCKKNADMIGRF